MEASGSPDRVGTPQPIKLTHMKTGRMDTISTRIRFPVFQKYPSVNIRVGGLYGWVQYGRCNPVPWSILGGGVPTLSGEPEASILSSLH